MTTTTAADVSEIPASQRNQAARFLLTRLGSLFSILPLGVWTLFHLWANLAAWSGRGAWQESVTGHTDQRASAILVSIFVLGPLAYHTVWGLVRMFRSRPAIGNTRFSNLRYVLQRLAAIGLLAFLGAHLYLAWWHPRYQLGAPETFRDIAAHMAHHPPTTIVYALGILAVAYHLANGIWSFCFGWGITVSRSSQAWMEKVLIILFVIFLLIGWGAEYGLYQAGQAFPVPLD